MVVESSSTEVLLRRRSNLTITPSEPVSSVDNSDKESSSASERNVSDGEFDADVSTLDPIVAEELIETTQHMPHEAALDKLKEVGTHTPILPSQIGTDFSYKREVVWPNAIGFLLLHLCALFGVALVAFGYANYKTVIYTFALMYGSGLGVTMGAHRLWSHRAFKAKTGLKIFLLWLHTLAGQNCLYVWVRDHRQHHKYSDTDADPHNANRGFFFSHVGWLMSRKHPKVKEYGKKIDMSDLEADKYIMFQKDHYKVLYTIFALLLPTSVPIVFWGEDPIVALFVAFFGRAVISLNCTWLVNSAAHLYGTRPFDKSIFPVENMVVAFFAVGEGWHNYHHAFPWDYRASELGSPLNITGFLIDFLAGYGLIYDRKAATHNMIKNRCMRTGDDSHHTFGTEEGRNAVTTLFNMWKHPSNPTYNSIYSPKPKIIQSDGYALIPDEMSKNELDEDLLKKENDELEQQYKNLSHADVIENADKLAKYIVEKAEADKIIGINGDDTEDYENLNNNEPLHKIKSAQHTTFDSRSKDKSKLNLNVDDALFAKI